MSEMSLPNQSDFIREMQRLHAAQLAAATPEERDAADADLSHFLRMAGMGRLPEWYAAHGGWTPVGS